MNPFAQAAAPDKPRSGKAKRLARIAATKPGIGAIAFILGVGVAGAAGNSAPAQPSAQPEATAAAKSVASLQAANGDLQTENDELEAEKSALEAANASLAAEVTSAQAQLAGLQTANETPPAPQTAQAPEPPPPAPAPVPQPTQAPPPAPVAPTYAPPQNVYYENCDAVRAAGAAPIYAGQPGYSSKLDRDGDGIGCEK